MAQFRYHGALDSSALIQGIATALAFGTVPVAIKATSADAWMIGFSRLAISVALFPLIFPSVLKQIPGSLARWRVLGLMGLGLAAHWITYFISIKLSSAGLAAIGVASYGVHVMWMGCALTGTRPRGRDLLSLGAVLAGVACVAPWGSGMSGTLLPGFLLGLFSGWLWATLPLLNQRAVDVPVRVRSLWQYGIGLLVFAPFGAGGTWEFGPKDWTLLLYLGIVGTLLLHTSWVRISGILPASATSVLYYLHLPVALVLSAAVLGESLPWLRIIGVALIVTGSWMGLRASQVVRKPSPAGQSLRANATPLE